MVTHTGSANVRAPLILVSGGDGNEEASTLCSGIKI